MPAKFILPFIFSFLSSVIGICYLLRFGFLRSDLKNRFGGAGVILVFIIGVLVDGNIVITRPIAGMLVGGGLILLFGLWDDLKNIKWQWQLLFQILIALIAISFGVRSDYISSPFGGMVLLTSPIVYCILYTIYYILFLNSLNWLDGSDGLAAGVTLATLAAVFFLSFKPEVNQPAVAILAAIAGGAVLGFLVFNFYPSKILAGTSGAWFFGFLLASLSIFAGAKIATTMMAVLIPILDLVRVIWERWRAGQSIFQKDRRHLHYLLLGAGYGERRIALLYFLASASIGFLALNLRVWGKLGTMGIVVLAYIFFLGFIKKRLLPLKSR